MKTQLAKWGNSFAVRIPKPVADAAAFREGDDIELSAEGQGTVRLRKRKQKQKQKPKLAQLLRGIKASNLHKETDWGEPVGRELW
ncbi:MAG: AbrB/MazE/SpoVT family DNA-binding domain-containing protein [Candidatus Acidiferrum sp.]